MDAYPARKFAGTVVRLGEADARAFMRELVSEELRTDEVLEIGIIDPAIADLFVRQPEGLLQKQKSDH